MNNILLTRSIENKNYFLDRQEVNLKEFIEKRIGLLKNSILKLHKVELDLENITMEIDRVGFESILVNLLENATKYSESDSSIKIQLVENGDGVLFQIIDEGIGIPREKRESVFSKFYREENEMTRKSKGTGLGLSIVKGILDNHNAIIAVDNDNNNTSFVIDFPKIVKEH